MENEVANLGAAKIGCEPRDVSAHLERLGNRFFDNDSPARRACDAETTRLLEFYPLLNAYRETLIDVTRRYLPDAFVSRTLLSAFR
jgi:hypothetical protein